MMRVPGSWIIALLVLTVYLAVARGLLWTWQSAVANEYVALEMWVNLRAALLEGFERGLLQALVIGAAAVLTVLAAQLVANLREAWRQRLDVGKAAFTAFLQRLGKPGALAPVALLPIVVAATSWLVADRLAEGRLRAHAGEVRPNVILVVVDTLRADALGAYGSQTGASPNIDAFSTGAIVYRNMTAQSPCTINSSPSILASLYPSEHGYINYKTRISDRLVTLAENLREAGYDTFAVSSNPHVSRRNGLAQGFDTFIDFRKWADTDAEVINREFLNWLPKQADRPFFAMLWYIDPHWPYEPPPGFLERHLDEAQRDEMARVLALREEMAEVDAQGREILEALYRAEVEYFDTQFAALTTALEARGILEDAVVVLTSDHGESFGEHVGLDGARLYGHGLSLHEPELAVPLIVKLPGSRRSGSVEVPAGSIDVAPTILDAVGVATPAAMQTPYRGRSLLSDLVPAKERRRPVFAELITDEYGPFFMQSVQTDTLKRIDTFRARDREFPEPRTDWLDRSRDENPLSDSLANATGERQRLEAAIARWRDHLVRESTSAARFNAVEEEQLRDQLRALGYIE